MMRTSRGGSRDPQTFYRDFRALCRFPMIRLASLEIGDLWFYDGLSMAVTACVGERCLLVAYDTGGRGDRAARRLREAHAWLHGELSEAPKELHLVYAAREFPGGEVRVLRHRHGDWEGLRNNVPLPPGSGRSPWTDVP